MIKAGFVLVLFKLFLLLIVLSEVRVNGYSEKREECADQNSDLHTDLLARKSEAMSERENCGIGDSKVCDNAD